MQGLEAKQRQFKEYLGPPNQQEQGSEDNSCWWKDNSWGGGYGLMFFLRRFNLPCNHSKKMLDEKNGGIHSPRYLSLHYVFDVKPCGSGITPVWAWPPRPQPGTCSSKLVSGRSWNVQLVEVDEAGLYRFRYVRWTCCASIISPVTRCFSCVSSDQLHVKCFFSYWLHMACFSVSGPLISLIPLSLFQQGCFSTNHTITYSSPWFCRNHPISAMFKALMP